MSTITTLLNTVKNAVWKTHPRCGSCGAWTKANGVCRNPRCDHHGQRTAIVGACPTTTGNTKAQRYNLPKTWRPAIRTAAVNLAQKNVVTLPDGNVLAWGAETKIFTLNGKKIEAASGGEVVRAAYARLNEPARKFQDAIAGFAPDLDQSDSMQAYRQLKRDAAELHCLAHKAGASLNPGPVFCDDIRTGLARQVKLALEQLPAETLRQIAYAEGFYFPTLTQSPKDTGKPSSLVYWLNPIYKPGTAKVVQCKAMERWQELAEAERVETLLNETNLYRALDKAGYSAPQPVVKYALLMPPVADIAKVRLIELHTKIEKTAWKLARQHGLDHDDAAAEIRLAILDQGRQNPDFLLQTNSYILTHGVWTVKHQARNERRFQPTALDDELETIEQDSGEIIPDTATVLASLPAELRRVVELMLASPTDYLIGSGKINKTKLAEDLGMSWHAANARLEQIQGIVGSIFTPAATMAA